MAEQTRAEQETHLNMTGDDHNTWNVFTDDPYWIRRIEAIGVEPTRAIGNGFEYSLRSDQVLIRRGKRKVSEATRRAMISRLKTPRGTGESGG